MNERRGTKKDGLWGWVVVVAAFLVRVFLYGMTTTSGILYVIFLDEFQDGRGATAIIASLITAAGYFVGTLGGILVNRYGCRTVIILAGVIAGSGLIISTFASSVLYLIISYGVVAGVGFGLCFVPCSVLVSQYFDKRRNLALGLASSGGGLGSFVFPILLRYLIGVFGWRGTLLIAGGLTLNICVCGAVMRPFIPVNTDGNIPQTRTSSRLFHCSIFKNVRYLLFMVNTFLFAFGVSVVYVHLSAFGKSMDITEDESAHVFSAMGVALGVAKIGTGVVATHPRVDEHVVYITSLLIGGVCAAVLPLVKSIYWFGSMACIFSVVYAAQGGCLIPALCLQYCGLERLSTSYGMFLLVSGVGHFMGGPVAGWMFEITGVYAYSFYLAGTAVLASAVVMIIPWRCLQPIHTIDLDDHMHEEETETPLKIQKNLLTAPIALPELSLEEIPMFIN